MLVLATNSALDHIQFDGVNLDAIFPQPFYGGNKDFLIAGEFQGDDANFVGDIGTADVENEVKFFAQFPNQRSLGAFLRKGEPVAL